MKFVELWEKYYEEEVIGNLIQTPFANKRLSKKEIRALLNEEDERARNISFKELPAEAQEEYNAMSEDEKNRILKTIKINNYAEYYTERASMLLDILKEETEKAIAAYKELREDCKKENAGMQVMHLDDMCRRSAGGIRNMMSDLGELIVEIEKAMDDDDVPASKAFEGCPRLRDLRSGEELHTKDE